MLDDTYFWLGEIVDAAALPGGNVNEIVFDRAPFRFSVSLAGVTNTNTCDGTQSGYVGALGTLISQDLVRKQPGSISFEKDYLYSSSDIGFNLGFGAGYSGWGVSASINASYNWNSSTAKTRVLVKFTQVLYRTDMDKPADPDRLFASSVTFDDIKNKISGNVCPVYVGSVEYGRMGYLCIESDYAEQDVRTALDAYVGGWGFNAHASLSQTSSNVMEHSTMTAIMRGTDVTGGQYINGLNGFIDWISSLTNQNDITVGVPVAFHLYYLKNNGDAIVYRQGDELAAIYTGTNIPAIPPVGTNFVISNTITISGGSIGNLSMGSGITVQDSNNYYLPEPWGQISNAYFITYTNASPGDKITCTGQFSGQFEGPGAPSVSGSYTNVLSVSNLLANPLQYTNKVYTSGYIKLTVKIYQLQ